MFIVLLAGLACARQVKEQFKQELEHHSNDDVFDRNLRLRVESDRLKMHSVHHDSVIEFSVDARKDDYLKFEYNATKGNMSETFEFRVYSLGRRTFSVDQLDHIKCTNNAPYLCSVHYFNHSLAIDIVFSNTSFQYLGDLVFSTDVKMAFNFTTNGEPPVLVGKIDRGGDGSNESELELELELEHEAEHEDRLYTDNYHLDVTNLSYISFEDHAFEQDNTRIRVNVHTMEHGFVNITFNAPTDLTGYVFWDPVMGATSEFTGVALTVNNVNADADADADADDNETRDLAIGLSIGIVVTLAMIGVVVYWYRLRR